jgi:hypothetical protein
MMAPMEYRDISDNARKILPAFKAIASLVPYEEKGILYSEILFMLACLEGHAVRRVLESGRARGQSTLLLALALPQCEIVSIEFDPGSPDVAVAQKRLENCKNVTSLFGDAREELPRLLQKGDAVLIDGPKMFRAIRLALNLLASGKASQVFVHDVSPHTPERKFLDRFVPECRFSDKRDLAEITSLVDEAAVQMMPSDRRLDGFKGEYGYGFTLGCIPYVPGRSYRWLVVRAVCFDARMRFARKIARMRSR